MKESKVDLQNTVEEKNLNRMAEEDRRFLMGVLNQNVQTLQSQAQFKINSFLSYFAVYLSLVAVLIVLQKIAPYFYIITIIFFVSVILLFNGKKEDVLIKLKTKEYKKIKDIHFEYLTKRK